MPGRDIAAKPRKSILLSGVLSLLFGPLGWLYAAPWQVAIPAAAIHLLIAGVLPQFIALYILGLFAPISAVGGILYALGFNMAGKRTPLFGKDAESKKLLQRR
jgi:hypothetical protein